MTSNNVTMEEPNIGQSSSLCLHSVPPNIVKLSAKTPIDNRFSTRYRKGRDFRLYLLRMIDFPGV